MRYIVAIFIIVLCFSGPLSAQQRETHVGKMVIPDTSMVFHEHGGLQMSPAPVLMPLSMPGFESTTFQNPALPAMNFNPNNGWRIETGTLTGIRSLSGFPFGNITSGIYQPSIWDYYQGVYGIRTYQLNNKLSVGTAGYSERSFNEYSLKSGIYRQTNYGSSLFVGYKFSEKFSISASFTIRRNGDAFNGNQGMQGGSIFP